MAIRISRSNPLANSLDLSYLYQADDPWEIPHFIPDAFFASLAFPAVVAIVYLLLIYIFRVILYSDREISQARQALDALLSILSPTRSLWPSFYTRIAKRSGIFETRQLDIPASRLINDVATGVIQLRDAENDLEDFLEDRVCVDGWRIRVAVDWDLRYRVMKWTERMQEGGAFQVSGL